MFKKLFEQKTDESTINTNSPVDLQKIFPIIKGTTNNGTPATLENVEQPLSKNLLDNLSIFYAFDKGDSFVYLDRTELENSGLTIEQLDGLSKNNLNKYFGSKEVKIEGDGNIFMVKFDQNMESSLLLVEEFWMQIAVQLNDDLVIAIPSREILLFTTKANTEAIHQLREAAIELYSSGRYKLTKDLLVKSIDGNLKLYV